MWKAEGLQVSEEKKQTDVQEGIGCILFIVAIFLAIVLFNIAPELIGFLERKLND